MALGDLSFNGWTTSGIIPTAERVAKVQAGLRKSADPTLASRKVNASGASGTAPQTPAQADAAAKVQPGTSGEKTLDTIATLKKILFPEQAASVDALKDKTLASRSPSIVQPNVRSIVAQGSVYQSPDIQAALAGSVDDLNATSQMQLASREQLMAKVLQEAIGGNPLAWEAVRAGLVNPQANVTFNASVQPPVVRGGGGGGAKPYVPLTAADYQAQADKRATDAEAFRASQFPTSTNRGSAWMPAPALNAYPTLNW